MIPGLPDASVYQEFPVVAIIVLVVAAALTGVWFAIRDARRWAVEQDAKRAAAVAEERKWAAEQEEKRNLERVAERQRQREWDRETLLQMGREWQDFIERMQQAHEVDSKADRIELARMAEAIKAMTASNEKVFGMLGTLMTTLKEHIVVDDARFDVLLTDAQRERVDAKTARRR